jgi:SH3-like domain-containing protein
MRADDRWQRRCVFLRRSVVSALVVLCAIAGPVAAPVAAWAEGSGLPVPRFVTLRADEANMRTGPGEQYPIKWIYQRPGLPLEIIGEYHHWRHVRDWQGTDGWMHGSMLTGHRAAVVTGTVQPLHAGTDESAPVTAEVEASVVVQLRRCPEGMAWCEVQVGKVNGWIPRTDLWGVYDAEAID